MNSIFQHSGLSATRSCSEAVFQRSGRSAQRSFSNAVFQNSGLPALGMEAAARSIIKEKAD